MSGAVKFMDPLSAAAVKSVAPAPKPTPAAAPVAPTAAAAASTADNSSTETLGKLQALGSTTSGQASTILTSPLGQTGPDQNEDLARKALLGG